MTGDELLVLYAVFSLSLPTRLSIMEHTGLSNGRVTEALHGLREKGAITSSEETPQGQGRPSVVHAVAPEAFFAVGAALEVGSCTITAVSGTGEVLESRKLPTKSLPLDTHDLRGLLRTICDEATAMMARRGAERCIAAGLSVIGRVDTAAGIWLSGLLYGPFHAIDVAPTFTTLGVPFMVEDHARSLAFIELRRSPNRDGESFVLLYMGEGLGSALVLDGRIFRGSHGVAGEIGHIRLEGNDRRCTCGDTGCLETVASSSAVIASVKARIAEGVTSILATPTDPSGKPTLEAICAAASARDRLARLVLDEAGAGLGEACVTMMKIVNIPRIVVYGKGTVLAEHLQEPLNRRIRECAPQENSLDSPVRFIPYVEEDEPRGVALLAMDKALSADGAGRRSARRS
jgi:transcriptional regulator of PTS gene